MATKDLATTIEGLVGALGLIGGTEVRISYSGLNASLNGPAYIASVGHYVGSGATVPDAFAAVAKRVADAVHKRRDNETTETLKRAEIANLILDRLGEDA